MLSISLLVMRGYPNDERLSITQNFRDHTVFGIISQATIAVNNDANAITLSGVKN